MSVSDLLQFLATGRKTGTLKIGREAIIKQIYLEGGLIVGSKSNDPKERLGQVLLYYGKIAEDQLQLAMQIQRESGGRLGSILSAHGFVSDDDIIEVLRTRTLEIIYDLFIWEEGEFDFVDNESLPDDLIRIQVNATSVIMDGIYRIDEWARYRRVIKSDRTFFELKPGWTKLAGQDKEINEVLFHVEKRITAAEICYNMHTSLFHGSALLFDLVERGAISVAGEASEPVESDLSPAKLPESVSELLTRARNEIEASSPEQALNTIDMALAQEPQNLAAHQLREDAERSFIADVTEMVYCQATSAPSGCAGATGEPATEPEEGFVLSASTASLRSVQSSRSVHFVKPTP